MKQFRNQQRERFIPEVRLSLLENDADEHDEQMESLRKTLNWILGLLFAVLISTTTGTIMLLVTGVVEK